MEKCIFIISTVQHPFMIQFETFHTWRSLIDWWSFDKVNLFCFQEAETLQELKMKEYNKLVLNVGAQQLADIFKVSSLPQN